MRTQVDTDPNEAPDEWPGCFGTVDADQTLTIVDLETETVETTYAASEWVSYEVIK